MTHFDETSRWMEWSKNDFSHRLSPGPTAVGAGRSAVAVHVASRRWLTFFVAPRGRVMRICGSKRGVTKLANLPSNKRMKTTATLNDWVLVLGIALVCELVGQAQVLPDPGPAPTLLGSVLECSGSSCPSDDLVGAAVIKSVPVGVRGPSKVGKSCPQGKYAITWQSL